MGNRAAHGNPDDTNVQETTDNSAKDEHEYDGSHVKIIHLQLFGSVSTPVVSTDSRNYYRLSIMSEEAICAIVLDYRGAEKTIECLLSLARQGLNTVYVLDNSNLESYSTHLKHMLRSPPLTEMDYHLELLTAGRNLGFAKGVNFVLSHDRRSDRPHDYYLLLNNDALAGPSLVKGLLAALKENPQAALVAPRIVSNDPGREYGVWYHRYMGLLLSRPGTFRFHYFTGCCLMFPRNLVNNANLLDESFFMYGEDAELGWRLTRLGKKMVCAMDVFVEHDFGPSVDRSSFFYEYHMTRGHLILSRRTCLYPLEVPFLIITKYATLLVRAIFRSVKRRTITPLTAWICAWFAITTEPV